jgi:hypothetical protein
MSPSPLGNEDCYYSGVFEERMRWSVVGRRGMPTAKDSRTARSRSRLFVVVVINAPSSSPQKPLAPAFLFFRSGHMFTCVGIKIMISSTDRSEIDGLDNKLIKSAVKLYQNRQLLGDQTLQVG